jgi:hypothetical protein
MTIQQFADRLQQGEGLSPLLAVLQTIRSCELDRLKDENGLQCGWVVWEDDGGGLAETPRAYVMRPELRS